MKIGTQLLIGVAVILTVAAVFEIIENNQVARALYNADADNDAQVIHDMMIAVRRVYHKQFLDSEIELTDKTLGFLPAHAMSRISTKFAELSRSGIYFNNVSDRARNLANASDAPQSRAIEYFKQNGEHSMLKEKVNIGGRAFYQYSFPIWVKPYCLKCHGNPQDAPPSIREKYETSYGYAVGDLRGIVSIRLPIERLEELIFKRTVASIEKHVIEFLAIFILFYLVIKLKVITRIKEMAAATTKIANGHLDIELAADGTNELALLAKNINRMSYSLHKREQALKSSEKLYRTVADSSYDAIVIIDIHGVIQVINPAACAMFGYRNNQLVGQNVTVLMPPKFRQQHNAGLANYLKTGQAKVIGKEPVRLMGLKSDNSEFPLVLSIAKGKNFDGAEIFIATIKDISNELEQKRQIELSRAEEIVVGELLKASLTNHYLNGFLQNAIQILVTQTPWLKLQHKGAIFLVSHNNSQQLILSAHYQLSDAIVRSCQSIRFGQCLCGRAAQSRNYL